MKLMQIRLLAKDWGTSVAFYRDVLELKASWYSEELQYALFEAGSGTRIELLPRSKMAEVLGEGDKPAEAEGQTSFLLNVEVEDVDTAYRGLCEKGVTFVNEPHDRPDWNARVAHFRDPDGTVIELYKTLQR